MDQTRQTPTRCVTHRVVLSPLRTFPLASFRPDALLKNILLPHHPLLLTPPRLFCLHSKATQPHLPAQHREPASCRRLRTARPAHGLPALWLQLCVVASLSARPCQKRVWRVSGLCICKPPLYALRWSFNPRKRRFQHKTPEHHLNCYCLPK